MSEPKLGCIFNPDAVVSTGKPLYVSEFPHIMSCVHDAATGMCWSFYDARVSERLYTVLAEMRKDGNGLSDEQEKTVRRGLGI